MTLSLIRLLGDGGFGEVWEADDGLDRKVAAKLFRPGGAMISSALEHARALARVRHPNVIRVLQITETQHPLTGETHECVVMELVEGETLYSLFANGTIDLDTARSIGLTIIEGLGAIHDAGLVHGDLHSENVMVENGQARIIDILYRGTLSALPTGDRALRVGADLTSLRLLLVDVLHHAKVDPGEATKFNYLLATNVSLAGIRDAWRAVTDASLTGNTARQVQNALRRLTDRSFVEGDAYASALAQEIPNAASSEILLELIRRRSVEKKHVPVLQILARRLTQAELAIVARELSDAIDSEVPDGEWYGILIMLKALGEPGWNALRPATAMRLEHVLVSDVLSGRLDIHALPNTPGGVLGTHSRSFWRFFSNKDVLFRNLTVMLRQNWYSQNYVAEYFLPLLPRLADTPEKRADAIRGLVVAVGNDARVVVNKLGKLPEDWQSQIRGIVNG